MHSHQKEMHYDKGRVAKDLEGVFMECGGHGVEEKRQEREREG